MDRRCCRARPDKASLNLQQAEPSATLPSHQEVFVHVAKAAGEGNSPAGRDGLLVVSGDGGAGVLEARPAVRHDAVALRAVAAAVSGGGGAVGGVEVEGGLVECRGEEGRGNRR